MTSRQRDIIMSCPSRVGSLSPLEACWRQYADRHRTARWITAAYSLRSNATLKHIRGTEMKTLLLAGATLALLTAVNFSPAMAQGPKLSGGNTWAGISQRVDTSSAATTTAHYEYRYGYDKHAAWRGHWVLVR
jgi:hypothetical protein